MHSPGIFAKGAQWKHKNIGFFVFVREKLENGSFLVGRLKDEADIFERDWHLPCQYTADELLYEFEPVVFRTAWNKLLDDGLF
jgi:hypothetical protein